MGARTGVIYKRTVSHATVMRAMVVALISACVVGVDLLLLTIAEQDTAFVDLMFETLSAFGTVGVSQRGHAEFGLFRARHFDLHHVHWPRWAAYAYARRSQRSGEKERCEDQVSRRARACGLAAQIGELCHAAMGA